MDERKPSTTIEATLSSTENPNVAFMRDHAMGVARMLGGIKNVDWPQESSLSLLRSLGILLREAPRTDLTIHDDKGKSTGEMIPLEEYAELPSNISKVRLHLDQNGNWQPVYDRRVNLTSATASSLHIGDVEVTNLFSVDEEGYIICTVRETSSTGTIANKLIAVSPKTFSEAYLMAVAPHVKSEDVVKQLPSTDATLLEETLTAYSYKVDDDPDQTGTIDLKSAQFSAKALERAHKENKFIARAEVITALTRFQDSLLSDALSSDDELRVKAIAQLRKEHEQKQDAKLVATQQAPDDPSAPVTHPPEYQPTPDEITRKMSDLRALDKAEAKRKLETTNKSKYNEAQGLLDRLAAQKDKPLTSNELYGAMTLLYQGSNGQLVERNNKIIAAKKTELEVRENTISADDKGTIEADISKLQAQNTYLEGLVMDSKSGNFVDIDTSIRELCNLVASGNPEGNVAALGLVEFLKDENTVDFAQVMSQEQLKKAQEYVDGLKLDYLSQGFIERMWEQNKDKIPMMMFFFIQYMMTELAKGVK